MPFSTVFIVTINDVVNKAVGVRLYRKALVRIEGSHFVMQISNDQRF